VSDIRLEWPREGVARIVICRARHHNALRNIDLVALRDAVEQAAGSNVRIIQIWGEGPSFGVGGDISDFAANLNGDIGEMVRHGGAVVNTTIVALRSTDKAVIVGARGNVAGGSVGYMLAGDFVVAGDDLRINLSFARLGASPDAGTSWALGEFLGHRRAFEVLALSETIRADQALVWGLVNKVVPAADVEAEVETVTDRLLAIAPITLANFKRLLGDGREGNLRGHLARETELFAAAVADPDFAHRVRAFIGKDAGQNKREKS